MGKRHGGPYNMRLPDGPLVAWYGDDYTGAAATMEVLTFAGLPSVLFLDPPTPEQLAKFAGYRGIGLAGTARAQTPDWMAENLPPVFNWLKSVGAKIAHYKICSTFDSSADTGSIGKAMDIAAATFSGFMPILVAAPAMRRYQAFGTLFASSPSGVVRLDRHAIMSRHPVTPMHEADLRLVLKTQTDQHIGLMTVEDLVDDDAANTAFARETANAHAVLLDTVSKADLTQCGGLIWHNASPEMLAIGSQGVEYALAAYLQKQDLIAAPRQVSGIGKAKHMIAVSGSTSIITATQIDHAVAHGFAMLELSPAACLGDEAAFADTMETALLKLSEGRDVLLYTAKGPDTAHMAVFQNAAKTAGLLPSEANERLGASLGRMLHHLISKTGISRAAISGGDTSGHATRALGIYALTALAPTVPGASICKAHSSNPKMNGLQLALKGGQMGSDDYFDWIRRGGGPKPA
jgi:3-oxoisoapionate kinase